MNVSPSCVVQGMVQAVAGILTVPTTVGGGLAEEGDLSELSRGGSTITGNGAQRSPNAEEYVLDVRWGRGFTPRNMEQSSCPPTPTPRSYHRRPSRKHATACASEADAKDCRPGPDSE